jgi:hypothetical protein
MKYCPNCKTQVKVHIAEEGSLPGIPGTGRLVSLLSPGETHVNRVYTCDICHKKIPGMTFWNAILVPLLLIAFFIVSVVLFIFLILKFVS